MDAPTQAESGSAKWLAQQAGGAIGTARFCNPTPGKWGVQRMVPIAKTVWAANQRAVLPVAPVLRAA